MKISNGRKTIFFLMVITLIAKFFGFLREIVLANYFGTSMVSDVYKVTLQIPQALLTLIGAGISTGFIPIFNKVLKNNGKDEANKFLSNLIKIGIIASFFICLLVFIFPNIILTIFAPGFIGESKELTLRFIKISIWGMLFSIVLYVITPFLQIKNRFYITAMVTIPSNILIIETLRLGKFRNINYLPIGILLSMLLQFLILYIFSKKEDFRYTRGINFKDENVIELIKFSVPIMLGVSVLTLNQIIDKSMASNLGVGSVSALDYGYRLNLFIQGIFLLPLLNVVYPKISNQSLNNNLKDLKKTVVDSFNYVLIIVIPAAVGLMFFSSEVVRIIYKRGSFNEVSVINTSSVIFYSAIGLIVIGFRDILTRIFYSLGNSKLPTINSIIALVINIILNIIFASFMGVSGLALGTSISLIICTILLFINLKKVNLKLEYSNLLKNFTKIIVCAILMGLISKKVLLLIGTSLNQFIALIIAILLAMLIYAILLLIFKVDIALELKDELHRLMKKKNKV